ARGTRTEHHHAAALCDHAGNGESGFARMFKHDVRVNALAGAVPARLAEFPCFFHEVVELGGVPFWKLAPPLELLAVDYALRAHRHDEIMLGLIGDDADRIGARRGAKLHREGAEAARGTPDENILAGRENVWLVAEEHSVGGGKRQRVTGAFFPC